MSDFRQADGLGRSDSEIGDGLLGYELVVPYDQFDVSLHDEELLAEVELVTNLIVAATGSAEPLTPKQVDQLLGVVPRPRTGD